MSSNSLLREAAYRFVTSGGRHTVSLLLFLVATNPSLPAQSGSSRASVLFPVYHQYVMATEAHDLDKLQALSSDQTSKQQLEKLKELKDDKQQKAMLDFVTATLPDSPEIVNEKIVGDRGLLAIQGYSRGRRDRISRRS